MKFHVHNYCLTECGLSGFCFLTYFQRRATRVNVCHEGESGGMHVRRDDRE